MSDTNKLSIDQMRKNYTLGGLLEKDTQDDPVVQFQIWFEQSSTNVPEWFEPNAMTLSTSTPGGDVTSRIVLLKGIEQKKFLFYTNYESAKGDQMRANPKVSLCFYWPHLQRQIRIEGTVEKVPREMSREYFHSRPRDSQLGAHVSQQSSVIASRDVLEKTMADLSAKYPEGTKIPLPDNWGGYAVTPKTFEFWQGRTSRLHDRLVYEANGSDWTIKRLSP